MHRLICLQLYTAAIVFALYLLFIASEQTALVGIYFVSVSLPALLTVGAMNFGPAGRTFCIGGLFPTAIMMFAFAAHFNVLMSGATGLYVIDPLGSRWAWLPGSFRLHMQFVVELAGLTWVMCILVGLMAVSFRWLIIKGKQPARQRPE